MNEHFVSNSNYLENSQQPESIFKTTHQTQSIKQAQESIYSFLADMVKKRPPEDVLQEFNLLFIQHIDSASSDVIQAIYTIGLADNEEEFRYTIKRSCYTLINNWKIDITKKKYIRILLELFANPVIKQKSLSPTISRLRSWTQHFVNSNDYEELKLFASTKAQKQHNWINRYTCYSSGAKFAVLRKL